jgi:hypothetical protein
VGENDLVFNNIDAPILIQQVSATPISEAAAAARPSSHDQDNKSSIKTVNAFYADTNPAAQGGESNKRSYSPVFKI